MITDKLKRPGMLNQIKQKFNQLMPKKQAEPIFWSFGFGLRVYSNQHIRYSYQQTMRSNRYESSVS